MRHPHPYTDLLREITREEYEADIAKRPRDEDGELRPTWDELMSVKLDCQIGEWKGFVFYGDTE